MKRFQRGLISRRFVWGFEGTTLNRRARSFFRKYPPAGVILFRRNIESPRQLAALTADLRKTLGQDTLIGIDQEGGRVSRLREPFAQYPPARVLCDWARRGVGPARINQVGRFYELITEVARFMGQELASLGINLDFAPVLDVGSNPRNTVIGDRAFSSNPQEVAKAGVAFFRGLMKEGVIACGKHFPGHGSTSSDSHLVLPVVRKGAAAIARVELEPFRAAVRGGIPMLMTAHVLYPALDPERPATLSRPIVTGLLRKKMGYRGIVITDDLLMKGISSRYSLPEACLLSLEAGCDLLLVCRGAEEGEKLIAEVAQGQ